MRSVAAALERRREAADGGTPPRLTRFNVQSGVRDIRYDVDRARRELGWESFVDLDEALRRTLLPRDG
jgi:nucleoside-diphosphate-sugar epimerase